MTKYFRYDDEAVFVSTTCGTVHGYEYDGLSVFKGIPYAKAKRFQDPEPVSWDGVFEATGYGYGCAAVDTGGPPSKGLTDVSRYTPLSEDCQNLNIWTPGCDGEKRPVMVWLHGGAMSFGSSSADDICEGDEMARYGNVVVVSLNHRLNVLGFCDLSEFGEKYRNSGNQGIADMVAALRWVRDNIERFGGDPGNVTLFGQSGGGMKVTALIQTPAADGLFHKGIIMSGVQGGALVDCVGSGRLMGEFLLKELSLSSVDELSEVPFGVLSAAFKKMRTKYRFHGVNAGEMPFRGNYYLGDPLEVPFRKETAGIPLLVGSTFGEFDAFRAMSYRKYRMSEEEMNERLLQEFGKDDLDRLLPLFREAYPDRKIVDLIALDAMFRNYIISYMTRRSALNDCTWEYMFDLDMPSYGGIVPAHGNDLGFIFHTTDRAPGLQEPGVTEKAEAEFFNAAMAFARTGDPNHGGIPRWEPSKPDRMNTLVLNKNTCIRVNYDQKLNALLSEVKLPKQLEGLYVSVAKE
ncbi:MAG: carboxylesterase/lipase family protein [Lachnospiraceae bacterium]|nr:carboxylesterase/lipase family protein [Lachnospiraceae bacterium]